MDNKSKVSNHIFQSLETERLILRQLTMDDKEFIFRHFSDPEVCRYFDQEPFTTAEEAQELIEWYARPDKDPWRRWGIVIKDDGMLIGTCGYHKWDRRHMRVEIGYDLYKDHWNHGYMTEALKALIDFCFDNLKVNRIEALVHPENSRSIKLLTKYGFREEGILREYVCRGGRFDDQLSLSLLKREWLVKNAAKVLSQ